MAVGETMAFATHYAPHQAIERLAAAVRPTAFHTPFREAVVGRVSDRYVRLRRHRPWLRNGFAPVFVGAFATRDGVTRLEGRFGLHPMVRLYLTFWYGILAVMVAVFTMIALTGGPMRDTALFVLVLAGLAVFPTLLIRLGSWLGRGDVDYIASVIRLALSDPSPAA